MSKAHQRTVVITGCDVPSSYGYELALCLDHQGYTVFAGCTDCNSIGARSLASRASTRLGVLQIDVTKQEEIDDAREMIQDLVGDEGVWAVVNCAESYAVAEVDWCSNEDFDQVMQVNFHGAVRVTKALLPLLRKARGRVVNLSSISGCVSRAGQSAFAASKFALEAFSDSLRQEMLKWGVYVSIVQPAFFPDGEAVLNDAETSSRLQRVPQEIKDIYGDEYFVEYIKSVAKPHVKSQENSESSSTPLSESKSSTMSSGYSSMSSSSTKSQDDVIQRQNKFSESHKVGKGKNSLKAESPPPNDSLKKRSFSTLSSSASSTLKSQGLVNLSNMNRVLLALVDAVTAPSPKVRYFVGTFQDRMLKILSPLFPTVFVDTYFTSGDMGKVVPKRIKQKME